MKPAASITPFNQLENSHEFVARHLGITPEDEVLMLNVIGAASRRSLIESVVPRSIARRTPMALPAALTEAQALTELKGLAAHNRVLINLIGQGYHATHTPGVILRNILENPAWYTAYTPYQAEISQGRLEALINFQTLVTDLTGMAIAGASMLDEATAAAEAMTLALRVGKSDSSVMFVADDVLPQTLEVLQTRAQPLGLKIIKGPAQAAHIKAIEGGVFAALFQYPGVNGVIHDLKPLTDAVHEIGGLAIVAADLLALTVLRPPGHSGADIVVGTAQRLGMPMGNGGPHAAYLATQDDFKRSLPGRLVGASIDAQGRPAYRLALQTREQHIRREKATSNICTAQVLPAIVASMFAVYHGPQGLRRIALRVASYTAVLAKALRRQGHNVLNPSAFDTLHVNTGSQTQAVLQAAVDQGYNLRRVCDTSIGITIDETTRRTDIALLSRMFRAFAPVNVARPDGGRFEDLWDSVAQGIAPLWPTELTRTSAYLSHPVFNTHHSETQMLRYIRSLSDKDLALDRSMIPLGSCTMKLNATSEMIPVTWPEFAHIHPFAPADQLQGYKLLREQLENWLCQATGYSGVSLQPNAGSQGEYAGLLIIKAYHEDRGEGHRNICLIPESAHGTNPASAQMAGLTVRVVKCDADGNTDMDELKVLCEQHSSHLAAVMITYPSTHGVFEVRVKELCALVHQHGGRVYVDGANMNALVGVAAPGEFGGDVSHLNLHKTFCIPHGGGGPGVGPVAVVADLVPYLPKHQTAGQGVERPRAIGAISAAPLGNAGVLPISWMYCRMMGANGLIAATETAILSANYVAARLASHYPVLFSGKHSTLRSGGVAHECILDLRPLKDLTGISAEDIAKRLIDYGFHAPTLSFPVAGTLMIEPTESEPLTELDRFCDAMITIRQEIRRIENGDWPKELNPLKAAPHTIDVLLRADWSAPYTREQAAYPVALLRHQKYWAPVGRIDNVHGDRHLFCACLPIQTDLTPYTPRN